MNEICDLLGSADEEEMNVLMEELGTIQYNKQKDKYELYNC